MSILKEAKSDGIYFYTRTWSDAGELEQGHFQYESDIKGDVSQSAGPDPRAGMQL